MNDDFSFIGVDKMKKWILLLCGTFLVFLSIWTIYYAYTPKVGPIGNGLNYKLIWFQSSFQFISGISSLFLAFNLRGK